MKRIASLVAYGSSDEEEGTGNNNPDPKNNLTSESGPKRKLPRLSPSLVIPSPKSDPSQHQGRIRGSPHVEGQFAAYVYIRVPLDNNEKLKSYLVSVIHHAKEIVPEIVCDWVDSNSDQTSRSLEKEGDQGHELHISLTRPIYLRYYQREDLKRAVKQIAQNHSSFSASFSAFASFDNEERTRTFLAVEIGAGHSNLKKLSKALDSTLELLHQKCFYEVPRFHASIAWALLGSRLQRTTIPIEDSSNAASTPSYRVISSFPENMLSTLTEEFGETLASKLGVFEVDQIKLRIGKDTFSWMLSS